MNSSRTRLTLFYILCVLVLLPRLGGPHLHLCLDGSGPAISLHTTNGAGDEALLDADDSHQDETVDVATPVISKVWPPGLDGVLFLLAIMVLFIARQIMLRPIVLTIARPQVPLFLRPPLRGPPA